LKSKLRSHPPVHFANHKSLLYLRQMKSAQDWIAALHLVPHVEGGFFRESHRASEILPPLSLPARYQDKRTFCSAIYFLLEAPSVSRLHRLKSDEMWFFHVGSPLILHIIEPDGSFTRRVLGADMSQGQHLHAVVERGSWFGATVGDSTGFALVSCVVAPAFQYSDLELADRQTLLDCFPQHESIINMLTSP
jgi:uncharacterized protein